MGGALAAIPASGAAKAAYEEAAGAILCSCGCHPQSVKDCACREAEEVREAIGAKASAGQSGEAIIASYVAEFGEKILVVPKAEGLNLVAWTAPGIGLVLAAAGVALLIRRWRARGPAPAPAGAAVALAADDPYAERLAREIEDLQ